MFGKPEWFVPKKIGWGLRPVTWQGWVYALAWATVIVLPFNILLFTRGWIEAVIWMAVMLAWIVFDVYLILKAIKAREEEREVLRIMDEEETRREEATTSKFAMHVTDSHAEKS